MKAKSTPYDRFGVHMERLINKMNENRHRFKYFPKGPQGMLYTVKPKVRIKYLKLKCTLLIIRFPTLTLYSMKNTQL